jgi:D-sedoheptulose 7-phosphate isomerase
MVKSEGLFPVAQECEFESSSDSYVRSVIDVLARLPVAVIDEVVASLFEAYRQERTVYLFGNGGSAALASHAACDLGKGTTKQGRRPFRVVSLTDNMSLITAWANDTNYAGDIAFAISGSGDSPNVLSGLRTAREVGAFNIGLTGFHGGRMKALCDSCIIVPSENMQHIEDSHLCIMHAIFLAFSRCLESTYRDQMQAED